jgi:hypothetical protein
VDVCLCESGYSGATCEKQVAAKKDIQTAVICAAVVPIALILIVAALGWACCRHRTQLAAAPLLSH